MDTFLVYSFILFRNHLNSSCAVVSNSVPDINAWSVQPCSQTRAYVCRKPQGKFMYTLADAAFKSSFKYMRCMLHKQKPFKLQNDIHACETLTLLHKLLLSMCLWALALLT